MIHVNWCRNVVYVTGLPADFAEMHRRVKTVARPNLLQFVMRKLFLSLVISLFWAMGMASWLLFWGTFFFLTNPFHNATQLMRESQAGLHCSKIISETQAAFA